MYILQHCYTYRGQFVTVSPLNYIMSDVTLYIFSCFLPFSDSFIVRYSTYYCQVDSIYKCMYILSTTQSLMLRYTQLQLCAKFTLYMYHEYFPRSFVYHRYAPIVLTDSPRRIIFLPSHDEQHRVSRVIVRNYPRLYPAPELLLMSEIILPLLFLSSLLNS